MAWSAGGGLAVGDLVASHGELAKRWGWSRGRVRHFLARRAKSAHIALTVRAGCALISVVNPGRYLTPTRKPRANGAQFARNSRAIPPTEERARDTENTKNKNPLNPPFSGKGRTAGIPPELHARGNGGGHA